MDVLKKMSTESVNFYTFHSRAFYAYWSRPKKRLVGSMDWIVNKLSSHLIQYFKIYLAIKYHQERKIRNILKLRGFLQSL